jgi:replicative DNA helicase
MATAETNIPPQNLEAEESVLGAMMVSTKAVDMVLIDARLGEDDFYRERHRVIYRAIKALNGRGEPVDSLTVIEHLTQTGELAEAGGQDAVASLASTTPAPLNAGHYAKIVRENALLRRLLETARRIEGSVQGREAEPRELVEKAETLLFKVAHEERADDFQELADILGREVDRLEKVAKSGNAITGTPSGFDDLDAITGGFQPGNLIIVAARPGMGKSGLVANIAENVAVKSRRPVAFFSLEMSEMELAQRLIAKRARIPSDKLRKGAVGDREWSRLLRECNKLEDAPLWIDESSDLSILELRGKARRLHSAEISRGMGGLGLIIIDYIQLMRADDPRVNRVEQVGQMSRGLKLLARELDVPVIALSQLSRAPEQRPGRQKRPILSDLRESGNLEQDADLVAFIYRQDYYDNDPSMEHEMAGNDERDYKGIAELIVRKNRNGPTDTVELAFQEDYATFLTKARGSDRPIEQKAGEGPPLVEAADE